MELVAGQEYTLSEVLQTKNQIFIVGDSLTKIQKENGKLYKKFNDLWDETSTQLNDIINDKFIYIAEDTNEWDDIKPGTKVQVYERNAAYKGWINAYFLERIESEKRCFKVTFTNPNDDFIEKRYSQYSQCRLYEESEKEGEDNNE